MSGHNNAVAAPLDNALAVPIDGSPPRCDPAPRGLQEILNGLPALVGYWDRDLRNLHANDAYLEYFGVTPDKLRGRHISELLGPELYEQSLPYIRRALAGEPQMFERYLPDSSGQLRFTQASYIPDLVEGVAQGFFVLVSDITARHAIEVELEQSERRFQFMVDSIVDYAIIMLDADGNVASWNAGAERIKGYKEQEILGRHFSVFYPEDDLAAGVPAQLLSLADAHGRHENEGWRVRADGTLFWAEVTITALRDEAGRTTGYCKVTRDRTERLRYEQRLAELAHRHLRAVTDSMGQPLCTLDDTGRITYMNVAGEKLLGWNSVELQGRPLHEVVHRRRIEGVTHSLDECAIDIAQRARHEVRVEDDTFVRRDGSALPVSWVLTPVQTAEGDGSVIVITDNTRARMEQQRLRRDIEQQAQLRDLHLALDDRRFELFAQPIIDLRTDAIVSYELLLRMRERDGSIRSPETFLPAAERSGMIHELDRFVIREAARLASVGHHVELNLSADSLGDPELADEFIRLVTEAGAPPELMIVELTETALIQDDTVARSSMQRIRALGCEFALDDFGTGWGTFNYLKRLPIDYVKIDVDFIRDLRTNPASQQIVDSIIGLAGSFGHRTIAEGVEDDETLQILKDMGVDQAQGYHIGRPAPLSSMIVHDDGQPKSADERRKRDGDRNREHAHRADAAAGAPDVERTGNVLRDRAARSYVDALRAGDPHAAVVVVDRALRDGLSSVEIQGQVIAPAMHTVGELWERGVLTVGEEHLATAVTYNVMTRLIPGLATPERRRSGTVIVAAVEGEQHGLGLRMTADAFEGAGYEVHFLGVDLPLNALVSAVAEHRPAIVALGATMPLNAGALLRALHAVRAQDENVQLIIGGQGVPAFLRECAGARYIADSLALADFVDQVNQAEALPAQGELPPERTASGVGFGHIVDASASYNAGLEASFAETAAAAADTARTHARRAALLEQIAFLDPLTELWNRRAFDDRHQALLEAATDHPPAVLLIDVDSFKAVNDEWGHDRGDRALVDVARCISQTIRQGDFAARHGGDEFAVLLPDTDRDAAAEVGERIRAAIEAAPIEPRLTVSIGIHVPEHGDRRRATLETDAALYEAKAHGRNQIAFA